MEEYIAMYKQNSMKSPLSLKQYNMDIHQEGILEKNYILQKNQTPLRLRN